MKRLKQSIALAGGLIVGLVAAGQAGCQATRAGYESAPYTVLRTDGKFELRDYPALTLAETPVAVGSRDGQDGSFMRLFRFIAGGNDAKQKKIAMTTPVLMSGGGTNATMTFVLPTKLIHEHTFEPRDGGTLAPDQVRYVVAFDWLLHRWFVRPDIEKLFLFRADALTRLILPAQPARTQHSGQHRNQVRQTSH